MKIGLKQKVKTEQIDARDALNKLVIAARLNKEEGIVKTSQTYKWLVNKVFKQK